MVSPRSRSRSASSMASRARVLLCEGLGEQVGQVEHLDVAAAQLVGEGVVLVLRPGHPGDAVEEQLVVVARGQPLQLRAGPVQHHRAQPADLAVRVVRRPIRDSASVPSVMSAL